MALMVSSTGEIEATPQEVLEFVLDLERYRQADHKITRVSSVRGPDATGAGSVRMWGKLPGLPPAPDRQDFTLEKWRRLTFTGAPRQPGRLIFDFVGTFDCVATDHDTTTLTHAYRFDFTRPFRWLEARMASPLQKELDDEVQRLGELLRPAGTRPV